MSLAVASESKAVPTFGFVLLFFFKEKFPVTYLVGCIGLAFTFFLESNGAFVDCRSWGLSGVLIQCFDYSFLKSLKAEGSCL